MIAEAYGRRGVRLQLPKCGPAPAAGSGTRGPRTASVPALGWQDHCQADSHLHSPSMAGAAKVTDS